MAHASSSTTMLSGQCQCPHTQLLRGRRTFSGGALLQGRSALQQDSVARRCGLQVSVAATPAGRPTPASDHTSYPEPTTVVAAPRSAQRTFRSPTSSPAAASRTQRACRQARTTPRAIPLLAVHRSVSTMSWCRVPRMSPARVLGTMVLSGVATIQCRRSAAGLLLPC